MKLRASYLRPVISAVIFLMLGMVLQYRYDFATRFLSTDAQQLISREDSQTALSRLVNTSAPDSKSDVDFSAFWEVWNLIERDYLTKEDIDPQMMVDGAIGGMTASLGDAYTTYLPPDAYKRSSEDLAGSFYGVGIELGYVDGFLAAISPLAGSPAIDAGVEAGDLILRVKDERRGVDEDSSRWTLTEAVDNIRGPRGSTVTLTLLREGLEEPFEVDIVRDEIVVRSAEVNFVEHQGKTVAHIDLSRFGGQTNGEWDEIVNQIVSRSDIDGIVLDMRNNPGGYFDGAIEVASEFIESGNIVTQQSRYTQRSFSVLGTARLKDYPVEVLVNRGSASASEIVAGALRDLRGSRLIGENTFGKGTVQDRHNVSNGGGVHITVARWLLPGGDWIHDEGVEVDIEISNDPETDVDEVLLKAIDLI